MSDEPKREPNPGAFKPGNPYRIPPGVSGNPAGRAKGLEARTRDLLGDDIDAIIYVQRCVAIGIPPDPEALVALGVKLTDAQKESVGRTFATITRRDANEAAKLLTDRGWGKAKQHVDITDKTRSRMPKNMPAMTDEQLRALAVLDGTDDGSGNGATEH